MVLPNLTPRVLYEHGDHVCTIYGSEQEQLSAAVDFIREGLARRERCIYVCCDHDCGTFRQVLRSAGINVEDAEARGALVLVTKDDAHLKGGSFSPSKMIEMIDAALNEALAAGFAGLRTAGDITWVLDDAPGSQRLVEYEARLNQFFAGKRAVCLCQYDRRRLPAATLDHCLATHPWVRMEGPILLANPFYEIPEEAMRRAAEPGQVETKLGHMESARRRALRS
jgi:hypothetical protein